MKRFREWGQILTWLSVAAVWLAAAQGRVSAAAPADPPAAAIAALIEKLGNDDFFARQRAETELKELGLAAFDALAVAENHDDIEIAARAKYLLRTMRIEWTVASDPSDVRQLMKNYQDLDQEGRAARLDDLARLPDDAGVAALCRVARYEKSPLLSKQAALALLQASRAKTESWPARGETILTTIGPSPRPAADWLRAYVAEHDDAASASQEWSRLTEMEEIALAQFPEQSTSTIVVALLRHEAELLLRVGRRDKALATMRRLLAYEQPHAESLPELVSWLVEQQAWDMVDELAERFAASIEQDARLIYALAEARHAQGNTALAGELATRALALGGDNQVDHLEVGKQLRRRGQSGWAEAEFRRAVQTGEPGQPRTLEAQLYLAEMFYDELRYLDAARVFEEALAALDHRQPKGAQPRVEPRRNQERRNGLSARLHFLYACHYETLGDRAKQVEHLDQATEFDAQDVDVLIARFRLDGTDPQWHAQTRELIRETAEQFRLQIQQLPEVATPYNQLAWLIANTEGDQAEALAASRKSLEIEPATPGYLDTLARCYFAQADYENAVKYQSLAVELDPHTKQMARQLEEFRAALAEKKAGAP